MDGIAEIRRKLWEGIMTTIKIDHGQVAQIIVSDLLSKYKHLVDGKDYRQSYFKAVLLYYITPEELERFYKKPELIYNQE